MAEQNTLKTPTLEQVVRAFHDLYPPTLQAGWDKSGLIAGRAQAPVERILFAVDALDATAREAVDYDAGLMITHHPLLLRGVSFLPDTDYKGSVLHTLIGGACGLLAAHTNVDSAVDGTNDLLCEVLGLVDCVPLAEPQVQVRDGVEYQVGTGRVGRLEQPTTLRELAQRLAQALPGVAAPLRVAGRADQMIERVALCSGSGDSLFDAVRAAHVDVYITADLRHHPASEFREGERAAGRECALIDCSHAASESLWMQRAGERVQALLAERGYAVEFRVSELNTDPWDFTVDTAETDGSASTLR
ncbi:MAG: Nif3-like dinuclear metal center hexameric protein [Rothia sp. (in: high G+C Gram-positive bacteria)]|uniref:Nif3-like dinuclear metal center hexameric protein n=1 Tax=Rothia sp. (in: high G+C Gram-positive bacteria) TaxID=1885016 RepID=UPI0026DEFDD1|nr:Nif3-like dinuclear metal center hexameric protein [Rothia sp. (in: high G+C Gram-positive bacteria)]MDO5750942.1 Nif3-like dinuclear metal center hexameric protein [Rothia sp. (in: high G+C Gram-positive bacteria)]